MLSLLPLSWVPYAELIRLNKPAGLIYLYIPCLFSTFLAASITKPVAPVSKVLRTNILLFLGSFVFRSAACTWNDILDQDIDRKISRTRLRPMPRGAITTQNALMYTGLQTLLGSVLLFRLPFGCIYYSLPSIFLIGLYPLAKRVTQYPQVVLGLTWAWGAVIGFPAMGVELFRSTIAFKTAALLYASGIAWTVLYDTIYAHQDIREDKREGVKSIAIKFEEHAKIFLTVLGVIQIALLLAVGSVAKAGLVYFIGCGSAAITLGMMIEIVDLHNPESCWRWFQSGCWLTGGSVAMGCFGEYQRRLTQMDSANL